ncbi:MAG: hypothetical protein J4G18_14405 [Anaerolineae bacterium]|nr:hypothetical protein [Anaerolineae bacterium]
MSAKYELERDLSQLERMTENLPDYLLGDALYMPVGGFFRASTMPQLSLGALLLRRRRLTQLRSSLKRAQASRLDAALRQHDQAQAEWTLHYEKKLKQEAPSRLKVMRAFFADCSESPRDCAPAYPVEALRRSLVQEILLAMDEFGYDKGELSAPVQQTDAALRRILHAGDFIWSERLAAVYPREAFWWLYGSPAAG